MNLSQLWLVPDLHYGHWAMEHLCARPDTAPSWVLDHLSERARSNDTLLFLGDLALDLHRECLDRIDRLPGRHVLVRGNHDYFSDTFYREHGFQEVVAQYRVDALVFTHEPLAQQEQPGDLNVCAHVHNFTVDAMRSVGHVADMQPWHRVLSLEDLNYYPITANTILDGTGYRTDVLGQADLHKRIETIVFPITREQYQAYRVTPTQCPCCGHAPFLNKRTVFDGVLSITTHECVECGLEWAARTEHGTVTGFDLLWWPTGG